MEGNPGKRRTDSTIPPALSQITHSRPLLPRIAGHVTQLCGAGCVLVGTVAFALLLDQMDGIYLGILASWICVGMAALICGGFAGRPSPTSLVICAALDAAFAAVLFAVASRLPLWLTMMSAADAELSSTLVIALGSTAAGSSLLCLLATPVALRYWRTTEPQGAHELLPSNTAPGFPPPVLTDAMLGPADSGEIVLPSAAARPAPTRKASASKPPPLGGPAPAASGPTTLRGTPTFAPALSRGAHQSGSASFPVQVPPAPYPSAPPAPPAPVYAQPPAYSPAPAYAQPPAYPPGPVYAQPPAYSPGPAYAQPPAYSPAPAYAQPPPGAMHGSALPMAPGFDGTPPPYLMSPPATAPAGPYLSAPSPASASSAPSPASAASARSPAPQRRGLYLALAGVLVSGLCVFAVVVSSSGQSATSTASGQRTAGTVTGTQPTTGQGAGRSSPTAPTAPPPPTAPDPAVAALTAPTPGPTEPASLESLLEALHLAVARSDGPALQALLVPGAFAFGVRATGVHRTAEEVARTLAADLGPAPEAGFEVTPRGATIGREGNHAWIAEELEVRGRGESRTFAITMLAAELAGSWRLVACHWANRLPDDTIARLAQAGDLPIPEGFDDKLEAPAAAVEAFRSAFSSTDAFALEVSTRDSAFNFGSAPGERLRGGNQIRRVFKKLHAEISIREGIMVTAAGAWDERQAKAPTVAWGAANVEFATRSTRRILRVLAVLVQEGQEWRVVQTQWSDGA